MNGSAEMSVIDAPNREVFIIDDDPLASELLKIHFVQAGFQPTSFSDGTSAIDAAQATTPACIIVDLYMPGTSGLDVLDRLDAWTYPAPIFVNSARGDIACAVEAIRRGAYDFFEKDRGGDALVARVRTAVEAWTQRRRRGDAPALAPHTFAGAATLTPREHEVLNEIVACASNKEAATKLGISRRTVEIHRAHIMQKLGAKNSVDLIRIVLSKPQGASLHQLSA
jgi:FixJ family two-component response regulator